MTAGRLGERDEPDRASRAARTTVAGALAALDGRTNEAADAYRNAIRTWAEIGYRLEVALTGLEYARLLPDIPDSVRAGREAEEIFDELRAQGFVARLKGLPLPSAPSSPETSVTSPAVSAE